LATGLATLLLTGCGERAPSRSDIIGAWTRKNEGRVTFFPNGRFEARDVPAVNLLGIVTTDYPQAREDSRIDATGTWRLVEPPGKWEFLQTEWTIEVEIGPVPGYLKVGASLGPYYMDHSIRLDGDEDKSTFYERTPRGAHLLAN
jgi:hypothetical protein